MYCKQPEHQLALGKGCIPHENIRRLILALHIIVRIISAFFICMKPQPIPGLLEKAGLPLSCVREVAAVDSFNDWLAY